MRLTLIVTALFTLLSGGALHAGTVQSPDGRIVVTLDADDEGIPFYKVDRDGKPLLSRTSASPLPMTIQCAATSKL